MARKISKEEAERHFIDKFTQPIGVTFIPAECPECRGKRIVEIIYGEPSVELAHKADRGEVYLGGCVMYAHAPNPKWKCLNCMHEFS